MAWQLSQIIHRVLMVFLALAMLGMNSEALEDSGPSTGKEKAEKDKTTHAKAGKDKDGAQGNPKELKLEIENHALQGRPGQINDICKVKVYRQGLLGSLTITVADLPKGVTLDKTVIPEGKDSAVLKFRIASNAPPTKSTKPYFVFAKGSGMEGSGLITFTVLPRK